MRLELIFFFIIMIGVVISFLLSTRKKEEKEEEKEEKESNKPQPLGKEGITRKEKIAMAMKISLAGAIFLGLLWVLAPEFVKIYHKEIAVMVVAMIAGAMLLGIPQKCEQSSTRKILRVHYVVLAIALAGIVLSREAEKRGLFEAPIQPQATAIADYPLCAEAKDVVARGEMEIIAQTHCWSGNISIPSQHWFRFAPSDKVLVKTWSGRLIHDAPGQSNWLGNEILNANFRLMSESGGPVKVALTARPK